MHDMQAWRIPEYKLRVNGKPDLPQEKNARPRLDKPKSVHYA